MSSADQRMHIYDSTNQLWRRAEGTSTGILKSETTLDKTGLSTDSLQTAGNAILLVFLRTHQLLQVIRLV